MINERKKRNRTEKPWHKRHNGAFGKPIELCLCPACANSFYLMDDHYIKRVDRNQKYKETCSMCGYRSGYDYKVYDNSKPSFAYI